jgi:hypothetical protein
MVCLPNRPHSCTANNTMDTLTLGVGGGASGFHDEAGQGPSGARSFASLMDGGVGPAAQAARPRRSSDATRRRIVSAVMFIAGGNDLSHIRRK